jgi:Holliday junction DNA helicase RuvA
VPLSTYAEIERAIRRDDAEARAEATVRLFVHTHVREDALELYGFWTEREKRLFQKLIAVSGIGPRLAQVILSGMAPGDLAAALAASDLARLTRIPGVGKKTAERLIVELRDKMVELAEPTAGTAAAAPADDELVAALVNLGYKRPQAERAVADTRKDLPQAPFHELLRASLRRLSRV